MTDAAPRARLAALERFGGAVEYVVIPALAMLVSLALEGKFASHGLTSMDQDDDVLTSLARELVTEKGIGERAAAVWRSIQKEHQDPPPDPSGDLTTNAPPPEAEETALPPSASNVLEFPLTATPFRRPGRRAAATDQQLTLGF